jgi:hypothetical protein
MGYVMFYLAVVAACLLWSATFIAAAARTERPWLRRLLVAIAVLLPPLSLLPWVSFTGALAFGAGLTTNWFAPTLTACVAAIVGGFWIRAGGMSRAGGHGIPAAAAWPLVGLAAMFVLAKAVAFGTLLFIDNAVAAQIRPLRIEAAGMMQTALPPQPTSDDDAAPLYLRALAAIQADKGITDSESPLAQPSTVDVSAATVTEMLARHASTLDLLRRAADKPGCRFVRDWARPSIHMLLPEIQGMRQAARLLAVAARHAAATGDTATAIRDVARIHRMGMHAAGEPVLVCGLVGQAIDIIALETLIAVLPGLEKQDLPLLDDVGFRDFLASPMSYQRSFLGEEAFGLASIADIAEGRLTLGTFSDPDSSGGLVCFTAPLTLLYRCFLLPSDLTGYRGAMRQYQELAGSSGGAAGFPGIALKTREIQARIRDKSAGIFGGLMLPALDGILRSQVRGRAMHHAADVLVAATRVRLTTGTLPRSVDDLVPTAFATVPRDPFTADAPLTSARTADAWTVYSVGPNGKDDGGPPAPDANKPQDNDDVGLRLSLSTQP